MKPFRARARCLVCGSSELRTDEVMEERIVLLAECLRCDHRWTELPLVEVRAERPAAHAFVRARPDAAAA